MIVAPVGLFHMRFTVFIFVHAVLNETIKRYDIRMKYTTGDLSLAMSPAWSFPWKIID